MGSMTPNWMNTPKIPSSSWFQGSKYSSKYETSSRSTSSYGRDRDKDSPIGGMNGYRSVSPCDMDSPRDRGDRDRVRYQSSNYLKRDRDYKKDKYSGKILLFWGLTWYKMNHHSLWFLICYDIKRNFKLKTTNVVFKRIWNLLPISLSTSKSVEIKSFFYLSLFFLFSWGYSGSYHGYQNASQSKVQQGTARKNLLKITWDRPFSDGQWLCNFPFRVTLNFFMGNLMNFSETGF
jgi:hypothetical protein